jgi:hypothetical protein
MKQEIITVQAAMSKQANGDFSQSQLANLSTVIRVALEASDALVHSMSTDPSDEELRYTMETIISGVDSFMSLSHAYRLQDGARESGISRENISVSVLKNRIGDWRSKVMTSSDFLTRCRYLLDLFKLELALVALCYG